ncbi:MAG: hypothetical protein COA30_04760 [Sulfurimonas sp.]|nr:MAG: hypothetical protein COA30_04760 [Sulfurimonas sp.]
MLLKFINKKYRFELMESFTQTVKLGIVISNLIAPVIIVSILYGYISHTILLSWLFIHIGFLLMRMMINYKLITLVEKKDEAAHHYLKMMFSLDFLSAVLYGFIIWFSVLENIPDTHILLIGIIITALTTGSLSTLGSIFTAYILYLIPSFLFLISALIYHGGDIFYLFALVMFGMMGVFSILGYKHYTILRNAISLDTTFKSIYDNSADGVVVFRENNLISSNKAMVKLFKYESEAEFLSGDFRNFSPIYQPNGESSISNMHLMVRYALRDGYRSFEWLHIDKDDKEFWCEIVLTKIHLEGLDLLHGVWRDISHRKELEFIRNKDKQKIESLNEILEERVNEVLKSNRAKDKQMLHQSRLAQMGEMISMIAHQWRQPLTAIASAGAIINLKAQLNKLDKETALEVSQNITNYTQHLSATIDDFRDYFKQDKEKEATNFTYLVNSVFSIIRSTLENNNIKVIEELKCKDSFMAYSNELKQVIINLVTNAQDVLVDKKIQSAYIKLKSYSNDQNYILEISDNGGGISEDVRDKIFNPYFSTKLKKDGTGLGLYMSKTIVEEHCRGSLSCYNTQDGVCFKMELPHAQ